MVTKEERMREIESRKAMERSVAKAEESKREETARMLSIRERLMRRLKDSTVETIFKDADGEFAVRSRMMTSAERERFIRLNSMLAAGASDPGKYNEAMKGIKELAEELCVEESLGKGFWVSGESSDDAAYLLVLNSFNAAGKAVMEGIASFRKE